MANESNGTLQNNPENEEEIIKKRTTDEMEASQTDAKINNLNRQQTEVFLRIYDVTQGLAKVVSPQLLGFQIDGVWHTSIEIFENEYYFQNFLSVQRAGTTPFNHYTERISLGHTDCTQHELMEFFEASKDMWGPENYNIIENNCNNFTDLLANFLVGKGIPKHILELPKKVKDTEFFKRMMNAKF